MRLPFSPPLKPMLARRSESLPRGDAWRYEPKWDGFRALVYYDGKEPHLQSRNGHLLDAHFPELIADLPSVLPSPVVLDGEIIIAADSGLDFDSLTKRMTATGKRASELATEYPAGYAAFDLLAEDQRDWRDAPFSERRLRLEQLLADAKPPLLLTPSTDNSTTAGQWLTNFCRVRP